MRHFGFLMEQRSADWLKKQGLTIEHQNWYCPFGEIDLICKDQDQWIFVEVKYRSSKNYGGAIESINPTKRKRLYRSIEYFLQNHTTYDVPCRVDALIWEGKTSKSPIWLHNIDL
jgi:putative endonuclease